MDLTTLMGDFETEETRSLERRRDELLLLVRQHDEEKASDDFRRDRMEEELREIEKRLEALHRTGARRAEESRRSDEDDLLRQERIR